MPFLDYTIFFTKSEKEKSVLKKMKPKLFCADGHLQYTEWCLEKIQCFRTMNFVLKKKAPGGEHSSSFFATLRRPALPPTHLLFFVYLVLCEI